MDADTKIDRLVTGIRQAALLLVGVCEEIQERPRDKRRVHTINQSNEWEYPPKGTRAEALTANG